MLCTRRGSTCGSDASHLHSIWNPADFKVGENECTELHWQWLWLFCSCQNWISLWLNDGHRPFLPHVLVTAKLLETLLQLTEEAITSAVPVGMCPDFWAVAYHLPHHMLAYLKKAQSITLCPTPHPDLVNSFSLVSMRLHVQFCLSICDYMGWAARTISNGAINAHLSASQTRCCTTNKLLAGHNRGCNNKD